MKALDPAATDRAVAALVHGYYDLDLLEQLFYRATGLRLADEIGTDGLGLKKVAHRMLQFLESEGLTEMLLRVAIAGKPGNPKLQALGAELALAPAPLARAGAGFEATVIAASRLRSVGDWHQMQAARERWVCQVRRKGVAVGTGFLVAPGLVMSNWHVFEQAQGAGALAPLAEFSAVFDYHAGPDGKVADQGREIPLRADPAPADASAMHELDYLVAALDHDAEPGRGFARLGTRSPVPGEALIVIQHPQRRTMEVSEGSVLGWLPGREGHIVQHNVTTEEGSSGSPCFAADGALIALHHRAEPGPAPGPNRAVASTAILERMGALGSIGLLPAV